MRHPYSEGTIFIVPLRNGGYARGVVSRVSKGGKVLFGYFFGPRLPSPDHTEAGDVDPANAILRVRFGDLGLINGQWLIRGRVLNWDRSAWPMPSFVRRDPFGKKRSVVVRYADDDPGHVEFEESTTDDVRLETDSMSGYGAVEIKLTKLLES